MAEDDAANQLLVTTQLRHLGYEAKAVGDGSAVLEALRHGHWDAILMDCHMPGLDGFEATRTIRAQEAQSGEHVIIIALTANNSVEDRDACLQTGMDDYLPKPIKRPLLEAMLLRHVPQASR